MTAQTEKAKEIAEALPPITLEQWDKLRAAFPANQVGQLPQPYKKDATKGKCDECGKWHGLPAMHLDFVGHGAVTHRLLEVDPFWTWEPFAVDAAGLPALDKHGNLWIRLTVLGVTRIGVGDGATMKVLIGDAIRNAAMRFGVALDLWMRGSEDEKQDGDEKLTAPEGDEAKAVRASLAALPADVSERLITDATARAGVPGISDVLADDGWRHWLAQAIEHHLKAGES